MNDRVTATNAKAEIRRALEESEVEAAHTQARVDRLKAAFPSAFPDWSEAEKAEFRRQAAAAVERLRETRTWLQGLNDAGSPDE
jgi:glutathione S-transferase